MSAPEIVQTPEQMQALANATRAAGKRVGLVPTMGALHEGHLSLICRAAEETDCVIVSVYVNPTQFGPNEDFDAYPRQLVADAEAAGRCGAQIVFAPTDKVMYPKGYCTYVNQHGLTEVLCGARRAGHFRGVTTVCTKLFNICKPHKAFFGQKDYQQTVVIRRMVADLDMELEIVVCPTVREADGLAMSSRNAYLSVEERKQALCLRRALDKALELVAGGERSTATLAEAMAAIIAQQPLARPDYVKVVDADTLQDIDAIEGRAVAALAVFLGQARLIDNEILQA